MRPDHIPDVDPPDLEPRGDLKVGLSKGRAILLAIVVVLSVSMPYLAVVPDRASAATPRIVDDFEDGVFYDDTDSTGSVVSTTGNAIQGDYSAVVNASSTSAELVGWSTPSTVDSASFYTEPGRIMFKLNNGAGGHVARISVFSNGTVGVGPHSLADTVGSISGPTKIRVRPFYSNNTFDLFIDGVDEGNYNMRDSSSQVSDIHLQIYADQSPSDFRFDYVAINNQEYYGTISGTVQDADGNELENATIIAGGDVVATTNSSGYYKTDKLPQPKTYQVAAVKSGYGDAVDVIELNGSYPQVHRDWTLFELRDSDVVEGEVYRKKINQNGSVEELPVSGALVKIVGTEGGVVDSTYSDTNGTFTVSGSVSEGEIRISHDKYDTLVKDVSYNSDTETSIGRYYLSREDYRLDGYRNGTITDPLNGSNLTALRNLSQNASDVLDQCSLIGEPPEPTGTVGTGLMLSELAYDEFFCTANFEAKTRLRMLALAASTNVSQQQARTTYSNYLVDAQQVAYTEAKVVSWNYLANNETEAQALDAVNESVDQYYYILARNALKRYELAAIQGEFIRNTEVNESSSPYNEWTYVRNLTAPATDEDFYGGGAPYVEVAIDVPGNNSDVEILTYKRDDGTIVSPWPNRTEVSSSQDVSDEGAVVVEGPNETAPGVNGGARTRIAQADKWHDILTDVNNQRIRVRDNVQTVVNGTYSTYGTQNITATDYLSPVEIASRSASNYSSTGYFAFAAAELASLGYAGSLNHSHQIELYDGTLVSGTLFYTADDVSSFQLDKEYVPSNYNGTFLLATSDGIRSLDNPFTIVDQVNTKTGDTVGTADLETYTYNGTDTGNLRDYLNNFSRVSDAYDSAQARSVSLPGVTPEFLGGLLGDVPPAVAAGAAIGVGGLLLALIGS